MKITHLRTRFALSLGALAALTAAGVGVLGFRWTDRRFSQEIAKSLDRFANEIQLDTQFAARECAEQSIPTALVDSESVEGKSARGLDGLRVREPQLQSRRSRGRAGDQRRPPGVLVQCISSDGTITPEVRAVTIPLTAAVRDIARSEEQSRITETFRIGDERFRVVSLGLSGGGAIQIARQISENEGILRDIRAEIFVLAFATTAMATLVGWWLAGRTAKPIVALTSTVERITNSGRFDSDVPENSRQDETGRLTTAFQSMIHSLRNSRAQQDRLVHDASHELRTPLTSMRANIGLLRRFDRLSDDQRNSIIGDLDTELRELTDIVNELVLLAGDSIPHEDVSTFDIADLCIDVAQRWGRRSERSITVSKPDKPIMVSAKRRSIDRAISNVINNAVKFSPADSPIALNIVHAGQHVTLTVLDRGPGFSAKDLDRVFERFYRSDLHRSLPGSGLGLAIVADSVKEAGGTVTATNRNAGGGEVIVRLPISNEFNNG